MPYSQPPNQEISTADSTPIRLLFFGAGILAALAGYVNAIMLSYAGIPVSHMSGPVTLLGIDLGHGDLRRLTTLLTIMLSFMLGAMISGLLISSTVLRPGRSYGMALLIESVLLGMAGVYASHDHIMVSLMLAAIACGLQNALASSYRGLTIRTTHVTGIVTDIGVLLAHLLRRKNIKLWKLLLLVTILVGFICGGLAGVLSFMHWGPRALYPPAWVCLLIATGYYLRLQSKS